MLWADIITIIFRTEEDTFYTMALPTLVIGATFIALAIPFFAYFFALSQTPLLIIISLIAAVFFLVSLLVTSLIMYPVPFRTNPAITYPVVAIIVSSLSNEAFRFFLVHLYMKLDKVVRPYLPADTFPKSFALDDSKVCIASGIGYASCHAMMLFGFVFAGTVSRLGDFFTRSCGEYPLLFIASFTTFLFFILDMLLMIIAFRAEKYQSIIHRLCCVVLHLSAGFCTLSNLTWQDPSDAGCITGLYFLLLVDVAALLHISFIKVY